MSTISLIFTIIVILVLIGFVIYGFARGLLRILFTTFSLVIVIALSAVLTQPLTDFLTNKTSLSTSIQTHVTSYINEQIEKKQAEMLTDSESLIESSTSGIDLSGEIPEEILEDVASTEAGNSIIDSLPLPGFIRNNIKNDNTLAKYAELGVSTFAEYISRQISSIVMKAISFIALGLLLFIILKIITILLKIISKIPILHGINSLLGGLLGLFEALLLLWCIGIIIMMFSGTAFGTSCMNVINGSPVLTFIYNHNLPVSVFTAIF